MAEAKKTTKKVLIVEDDAALLDVLANRINSDGFTVIKAQDGKKGLELAAKEMPNLILLDLVLPKLTGLAFLELLRENSLTKSIPVFILTNLSENATIYKSVALHADAYFIKSNSTLEHIAAEVKTKLNSSK